MGKAIEAELLAKGHTVAGRMDEGDRPEDVLGGNRPGILLEGEWGGTKSSPGSGQAPAKVEGGPGSSPFKDLLPVDIAFEFTTPASAEGLVLFFLTKRIPVVSGTTGWDTARAVQFARERKVPFLHSPNFSIGVAVMKRLAAQAAALLSGFSGFEPGILERHHVAKKDAPSGTAKLLASAVELARPGVPVPVVALRQGGQPGEHVLYFEGASESLEIVHRARSRAIFAAGAVAAADWLLASDRAGPVSFEEFLDAVSRERSSR
ncbi:MAG: dihydrodipicolinate reductase C-terminal domain-containing protein [Acidithiobacillales bacterium]